MKNNWNKILNELSYRVSSGIPDLTNEQHLIKLWDILKEHKWSLDARVELLKRLDEQGKERPCPICEAMCKHGETSAKTGCVSKSGGGQQTSGEEEPTDKKSKKPKDKKKKLKKKRSKEERAKRVKDDLTSINEIEDDKEAHKKMREKQAERRDEIYKGADFPAGNEGSVTGENGGGIALEELSKNPDLTEDQFVDQELEKMKEACKENPKGCLLKKLGSEEKAREWLSIGYRTGLNEKREIEENPKYNAKVPQEEPYPSGHIMDYQGKELVKNAIERGLKSCDKLKNPKKRKECVNHHNKQLRYLKERKETDTGVIYETKDGYIGFKHTSNKSSLKDPHYNKSIMSKLESMMNSAEGQKERGDFSNDQVDKASNDIRKASIEAAKMVNKTDKAASQSMNKLGKDEESRKSLRENSSSLLSKLPGRSSTKGDDYANKVRSGADGYGEIRNELERLGIDVENASDEQIMQAIQNIMRHGTPVSSKAKKKMSGKKEGEVVEVGVDKSGQKQFAKMVMVDGKLEPRACDEDGNPVHGNNTGKLIYKMSEMINTMRAKAKAKTKPKGWGDREWPLNPNNEDDLKEFAKQYESDPPLTVEELKWMLTSDEADELEKANDIRKRGMDRVHAKIVTDVQNSDKEIDGFEEDENGNVVDENGDNGPATQQYVDSFMEDMHWNSYIDGDSDGVGDMSIDGQNVIPEDFRSCLKDLSGFKGDTETKEGREALKAHLRKKIRISGRRSSDDETSAVTGESKDAHISFDNMVPDTRRGKPKGAMRRISVGDQTYRSKGVGVNSVMGGLGLDMQDCLGKKMKKRNK
jgi:hypothetical protein